MRKASFFLLMIILSSSILCCWGPVERGSGKSSPEQAKSGCKNNIFNTDIIRKDFFGAEVMYFDRNLERMYLGKDLYNLLSQQIRLLKDLGIGLVGMSWSWVMIEPNPPRGEIHVYNWTKLDSIMKLLHDAGIRAKLQVFPSANWASKVPSKNLNRAGPIKENYLKDWKKFIQSLAERYDGDGKDDAFHMSFPVLKILNISGEVEAGNNWSKLGGTPEDYDKFLTQTTKWVKEASPSVLIARAATNFGWGFDRINSEQELKNKINLGKKKSPVLRFFLSSMREEDMYDLLGVQLNYHWSGIYPQIKWIKDQLKEFGYSKPIFGNHTRSTLVNRELELILSNPSDPKYKTTKALYLANQASHTIKKLTLGLACGLKFMLIATITDGGFSGSPGIRRLRHHRGISWAFTGLFDGEVIGRKKDISEAPKPVYYSYKLFINKLIGSSSIVKTLDLGQNIYAYRFEKNSKPIIILWCEDVKAGFKYPKIQSRLIELPVSSDRILITHIITEIGQKEPKTEITKAQGSKIRILLTDVPIFVEEL